MRHSLIDTMMQNRFFETLAFFAVTLLALVVFLAVFEWVTRYRDWEEIKKGNLSVAMATGGKIFGICNIFRFAITSKQTVYDTILWGSYGFVLLLAAYFLFEFLTPMFQVDREIERDNRAVGLVAMILSIALSYVIGASVR